MSDKILLLIPKQYTLAQTIQRGFIRTGYITHLFDYRDVINSKKLWLKSQMFRFPYRLRNIYETYFFSEINKKHIDIFDSENPDIVFIYNSEFLLPKTLEYFKQKSKIIFFLGDNPYYTPMNDYYLHLLFYANLIISPDSFWADQLKLLGIKNIVVDFPGYDETPYSNIIVSENDKRKYDYDILFIGTGYPDAWGYKRALFLNNFIKFNFKLYGGKHFIKWFKFFPELKKKFELKNGQISLEEVVKMHKCAKLYPVDANPAILNGVHLRVFDCIAMGVLPLVEYRKDHDLFFKGINLPLIKNYQEIEELTRQFLNHNDLREKTLTELQEYCQKEFSVHISLKRIVEKL